MRDAYRLFIAAKQFNYSAMILVGTAKVLVYTAKAFEKSEMQFVITAMRHGNLAE